MKMTLTQYYREEKNRVLEKCVECGVCAKKCPIIKTTELSDISPKEIQEQIKAYLKTGEANRTVFNRVFSCMQCFQCVDNCCPEGLDPLAVNEIIKWEYRQNKIVEMGYGDPNEPDSTHRVLSGIQLTAEEYLKISNPSTKDTANNVFFSGCNVYYQPEKLLNALDIMDLITDDYAFVPGLDFCCGNVHIYCGAVEEAELSSVELIEKLSAYNPTMVVFWCPTCLCRFDTTLLKAHTVPFDMMSFPQFLARNMDKLFFKKKIEKTVTLHEACKAAFTGLDLTGARDMLQKLPGINLVEMPRHGENTVCCGSGAEAFFPSSFETMRDDRLAEARQTDADVLVDVCHHCHNVFCDHESEYGFIVKNYASLVAEALGVAREDKFKKYKQLGDLNRILDDVEKNTSISALPFSQEKIIEVLKETLDL
jgi:Fe-S oxidoreductase